MIVTERTTHRSPTIAPVIRVCAVCDWCEAPATEWIFAALGSPTWEQGLARAQARHAGFVERLHGAVTRLLCPLCACIFDAHQRSTNEEDERARRFREQTGIVMQPNCGIDTSVHQGEWRGVAPLCEIVCVEFDQREAGSPFAEPEPLAVERQGSLFAEAAE